MLRAILTGGLAAGTLDILAACALAATRGTPPKAVLQYIASGLLGREAFQGGWATAALGLLCHFVIATGAAAVFVAAARAWPVLLRHPIPVGAAYGVVVWAVMNQVIVPLSQVARRPQPPPVSAMATMIVIHMLCVGIPIAWAAARARRA
jgi:uncharacterized membrane protein YagU involved in acid resistance